MNSNGQFRFSNNLTTAGCWVRQRFDEQALLGVTKGHASRSSRCPETVTENCCPEVPGLAVRIHFTPPISSAIFQVFRRIDRNRPVWARKRRPRGIGERRCCAAGAGIGLILSVAHFGGATGKTDPSRPSEALALRRQNRGIWKGASASQVPMSAMSERGHGS
jgi:hypothetical protein